MPLKPKSLKKAPLAKELAPLAKELAPLAKIVPLAKTVQLVISLIINVLVVVIPPRGAVA